MHLRRRHFCGDILSLALEERGAYPQNGIATRFGAQHLDREGGVRVCDLVFIIPLQAARRAMAAAPPLPKQRWWAFYVP